jgi:hypothetical protein
LVRELVELRSQQRELVELRSQHREPGGVADGFFPLAAEESVRLHRRVAIRRELRRRRAYWRAATAGRAWAVSVDELA